MDFGAIDPVRLARVRRSKSFPEMGVLAGESEYKVCLDTLKTIGVPHHVHHAPCAGNGEIGKDDAIQQAMLDFGHNVTVHATTGIQIGDEMLVFFTGGSGDPNDNGAFMLRFNVKSREIVHNTKDRKIRYQED